MPGTRQQLSVALPRWYGTHAAVACRLDSFAAFRFQQICCAPAWLKLKTLANIPTVRASPDGACRRSFGCAYAPQSRRPAGACRRSLDVPPMLPEVVDQLIALLQRLRVEIEALDRENDELTAELARLRAARNGNNEAPSRSSNGTQPGLASTTSWARCRMSSWPG